MITFAVYGPTFRPDQGVLINAIRLVDYRELGAGEVVEVRTGYKTDTREVVLASGPACMFQPIVKLAMDIGIVPGGWIEVRCIGASVAAPGCWLFYGLKGEVK